MLKYSRNLWILMALSSVAGCDGSSSIATGGNDVGTLDNAVDNSMADMSAPVDLSFGERYGSYYLTVRNTGSGSLTVEKLVVNGQDNDSDCNIKVFKQLEAGASIDVPVPRCGAITKVRTITDQGERLSTWDSFSQNVRLTTSGLEGYRQLTIQNIGGTAWTVNKVILNKQGSDPDCDVKVFREVPANGSISVPADSCGQINDVELDTSRGSYSFSFAPEASTDTGNSTGM